MWRRTGTAATVRSLLETGADVNFEQADGTTALGWSAQHDQKRNTVDMRGTARRRCELWHKAYGVQKLSLDCANRNAALVKLLLSTGANVQTIARSSWSRDDPDEISAHRKRGLSWKSCSPLSRPSPTRWSGMVSRL